MTLISASDPAGAGTRLGSMGAHATPGSRLDVGATDFNGDGYADLAIGAYSEDVGHTPDAGGVNVVYGSPTGLQGTSPDDQFWTQDSPSMSGDPAEAFDYFGRTFGVGDYNGDGFSDLAISAYGEDLGLAVDAGAVSILYGSSCGLQADPAVCAGPDDQTWTQDSVDMNNDGVGAEAGDEFGLHLTAGDFNGDGFSDLAIGAHGEDLGTIADAGAVNVLYGAAVGLQVSGIDAPDDQFWTQDSPGVQDEAEAGDHFGKSLTAGDFNTDGYDDLVIVAYLEDVSGVIDAGAVNVLYGSSCGLEADPVCGTMDDQFWNQDSPGVQDQGEA
jgi:hypothetical protein